MTFSEQISLEADTHDRVFHKVSDKHRILEYVVSKSSLNEFVVNVYLYAFARNATTHLILNSNRTK